MNSTPMFSYVDIVLAGTIGLFVLIALLITLSELVRYIKISSM
jgi:hypothetical protein